MIRPLSSAPRGVRVGFTLVESLLALTVAAGTLLTLVAMLPAGLDQYRAAADLEAQARISHYMLDRLQMMDWADLQTQLANGSTSSFPFDNRGTPLAGQSSSGVNSQCSYVARAVSTSGAANSPSVTTSSSNSTSIIPGDTTAQPWLMQVEIDISSQPNAADPFGNSHTVQSTIVTLSKLDH